MRLIVDERGSCLVVRVDDERIDAASAVDFKDGMRNVISPEVTTVVLDLSAVDAIDSSGLGAIVSVMKHMGGERRLELAALSEKVRCVFRLTRMDQVITIHESPDDAMMGEASAT